MAKVTADDLRSLFSKEQGNGEDILEEGRRFPIPPELDYEGADLPIPSFEPQEEPFKIPSPKDLLNLLSPREAEAAAPPKTGKVTTDQIRRSFSEPVGSQPTATSIRDAFGRAPKPSVYERIKAALGRQLEAEKGAIAALPTGEEMGRIPGMVPAPTPSLAEEEDLRAAYPFGVTAPPTPTIAAPAPPEGPREAPYVVGAIEGVAGEEIPAEAAGPGLKGIRETLQVIAESPAFTIDPNKMPRYPNEDEFTYRIRRAGWTPFIVAWQTLDLGTRLLASPFIAVGATAKHVLLDMGYSQRDSDSFERDFHIGMLGVFGRQVEGPRPGVIREGVKTWRAKLSKTPERTVADLIEDVFAADDKLPTIKRIRQDLAKDPEKLKNFNEALRERAVFTSHAAATAQEASVPGIRAAIGPSPTEAPPRPAPAPEPPPKPAPPVRQPSAPEAIRPEVAPSPIPAPAGLPERPPRGKAYRVVWADGRAQVHFDNLSAAVSFSQQEGREARVPEMVDTPKGVKLLSTAPTPVEPKVRPPAVPVTTPEAPVQEKPAIDTIAEGRAKGLADALQEVSEATPTGKLVGEPGEYRRVGGFKSLFPELQGLAASPSQIVAAIRRDKENPLYLQILERLKGEITQDEVREMFAETGLDQSKVGFERFSEALEEIARDDEAERVAGTLEALVTPPPEVAPGPTGRGGLGGPPIEAGARPEELPPGPIIREEPFIPGQMTFAPPREVPREPIRPPEGAEVRPVEETPLFERPPTGVQPELPVPPAEPVGKTSLNYLMDRWADIQAVARQHTADRQPNRAAQAYETAQNIENEIREKYGEEGSQRIAEAIKSEQGEAPVPTPEATWRDIGDTVRAKPSLGFSVGQVGRIQHVQGGKIRVTGFGAAHWSPSDFELVEKGPPGPAPEVPAVPGQPLPLRSIFIGRGKKGSVRVIFPDANHKELFSAPSRLRKKAAGEPGIAPDYEGVADRMRIPRSAIGRISQGYRDQIMELVQNLPEGEVFNAPPWQDVQEQMMGPPTEEPYQAPRNVLVDQPDWMRVAAGKIEKAVETPPPPTQPAALAVGFGTGDRVNITDGPNRGSFGTVVEIGTHPTRRDLHSLVIETDELPQPRRIATFSNMVEKRGVGREVRPMPETPSQPAELRAPGPSLPRNQLIQYPTKKWGFVGAVNEDLVGKVFGTQEEALSALERSGGGAGFRAPEATEEARAVTLGMTVEQYRATAAAPTYEHADRFRRLVEEFESRIRDNTLARNALQIRQAAAETLGVTPEAIGQDPVFVDDVFDALETAINRVYRSRRRPEHTFEQQMSMAPGMESALGRRTRTIEIAKRQQFSTPFPIAEAAGYALDVIPGETVVEPTAGTGNLLVPLPRGTKVIANEIDPRRVEALRSLKFPDLNVEVRQADALREPLPGSVVIMNPPWGKYSTQKYGPEIPQPFGKSVDISERFVAKAFRDIPEGGRVVAVMPTTILKNPDFLRWLNQNHTLRALIHNPPGSYTTRGTDVESVLLVADKGRIPNAPEPIRERAGSFERLTELVRPLSGRGTHARVSGAVAPAPTPEPRGAAAVPGAGAAERAARLPEPSRPTEPVAPAPVEPGRVPEAGVRAVPRPAGPPAPGPGPELVAGEVPGRPPVEPERAVPSLPRAVEPPAGQRFSIADRGEFDAALRSPIFTPAPQRNSPGNNPHPRLIVKSRSLAGADLPPLTYEPKGRLIREAYDAKLISDQQLDYGILPALEQRGYLFAADVGVGKTRVAAAVAGEWLETGQAKRILYVTASEVNIQDVKREFDLYAKGKFPFDLLEVKGFKEASERRSKGQAIEKLPLVKGVYLLDRFNLTAYRRALEAVGFDAIIGDEAHLYKNIGEAAMADAWLVLQKDVLNRQGRFLYLSATPATIFDDLEHLIGLREWAPDGFDDYRLQASGLAPTKPVGELIEMQDALREKLTEYSLRESVPEKEQERVRDLILNRLEPIRPFMKAEERRNAALSNIDKLRNEIRRTLGGKTAAQIGTDPESLGVTAQGKRRGFMSQRDVFASHISPAEQEQIMRELAMKGKYDSVDLWRAGLDFQVHTMAIAPEYVREYEALSQFFRELNDAFMRFGRLNQAKKMLTIRHFLQAEAKRRMFDYRLDEAILLAKESLAAGEQPIISTINVRGGVADEGVIPAAINAINDRVVEIDKDTGEITMDETIPEALVARGELLDRWREFRQVRDPVQLVVDAFGKQNVAVITGDVPPKLRERFIKDYQDGVRKVAFMSGAGKTGISLHHVLDTGGAAKGRRHLFVTDYEYSATQAKQEIGRTDRSGQLTSPRVTYLSTGNAPERKFLATVANRMRGIGAASKGSAESASPDKLAEFELGGGLDTHAMRLAYQDLPVDIKASFMARGFKDPQTGLPMQSYPTAASLKDFLLDLQFMALDASNKSFEGFWAKRGELLAQQEEAEEFAKTRKNRGEVLRSTELQPQLVLHEVKDESGSRFGILQGIVTPHMDRIARYLPVARITTQYGGAAEVPKRSYVTFNAGDRQISGLEIRRGSMPMLAEHFGHRLGRERLESPAQVIEALKAGDRVPLQGADQYELRQRKDGLIQIEQAKMSQRDQLLRHGAKYSPAGNFFHIPEDALGRFLERFPPKGPEVPLTPSVPTSVEERIGQYRKPSYQTRPQSTQSDFVRGTEAIAEVEQSVGGASTVSGKLQRGIPGAAGARILGIGITRDLYQKGRVDLRGQTVNTAEDLARLAQVFRNPQFETLRIFYVKEGQIVAHEGITSRMPGSAEAFLRRGPKESHVARTIEGMKSRMERLGADGYWMLHNHPSGMTSASDSDVQLTAAFSDMLPGMKGHVIIDSGVYTVLRATPKGVAEKAHRIPAGKEPSLVPELAHDLIGVRVEDGQHLVRIGQQLKTPEGYVSLIYRSGITSRAIEDVPVVKFLRGREFVDYVRARQREYGATSVLSFYPDYRTERGAEIKRAAQRYIDGGVILDHGIGVEQGGYTLGRLRESERLRLRAQEGPRQALRVSEREADFGETPQDEWTERLQEWQREGRAEERRVSGQGPKVIIQKPMKDYGWLSMIGTPANVLRRYGKDAAAAIRALNLGEINQRIAFGRRMETDLEATGRIPKADFGKTGEVFWDIFEGKDIEAIEARTDISQETKDAARYFREKFDADRTLIIERMREDLRPAVEDRIDTKVREEIPIPEGKRRRTAEQLEEIRKRVAKETTEELQRMVPDEWGIDKYLPHIFPGDFRIFVKTDEGMAFIGTARTRYEAMKKIKEDHAGNPERTAEMYAVDQRQFVDPDVVRVSRPRRWMVINRIADAMDIGAEDVSWAFKGVIGTKEAKKKWWGSLRPREGYRGFSQDLEWVLGIYNHGLTRWIHVTDARRAVSPLIDKVRKSGRGTLADELEANLNILWGYKSQTSQMLDNLLERIPGVGHFHRPFALERWTGRAKSLSAYLFLNLSPRFHFLNRLQTFQTLLPIVSTREFVDGRRLYRGRVRLEDGEELVGKDLLDKHGVRFLAGGKFVGESGPLKRFKFAKFREKLRGLAPETFNQEVAFLTMYLKARKTGLGDAQAAEYAFIRGNIYSQFLGLRTDQPRAMYRAMSTGLTAPVKSTIFQFRRFQIKNLELIADLLADKDFVGAGKWFGANAAIGGLKGLMNPILAIAGGAYITLELYNRIKEEYGETIANLIAYGLPGLLGIDLSYSVQAVDVPRGGSVPEAIGNVVLGPLGSLALAGGEAALGEEKGVVADPVQRLLSAMRQRAPALRWAEGVRQIWDGDYDFKDPKGRLKFKGDLKDVLLNMGGFRSLTVAEQDMILSAYLEVRKRRDAVLDRVVSLRAQHRLENADVPLEQTPGKEEIDRWNALYPEFPITSRDIRNRLRPRLRESQIPRVERRIREGPKVFRKMMPARP